MASKVPLITFNDGNKCPVLGLGTWKSKPGEVEQAVKDAIDIGYRHFDCAHVYGNEKEIGDAIAEKIKEGVVKREDLFITSKLWCNVHKPELVEPACRRTLAHLGLQQLDLYLIHWPQAFKEEGELFPVDAEGKLVFSDVDYVDTWKAMEELVHKGLTKSIGISNFNSKQVDRILEAATIKPVTNQIEVHPYLVQKKLFEFCKARGITITAYSPLGSPDRPWAKPGDVQLLEDPKLASIAKRLGKTTAQVLIRFAIDRGMIVIPKSVNKQRLQQNFEVLDFQLSAADIEEICSFDMGAQGRICPMAEAYASKDHPFARDEF